MVRGDGEEGGARGERRGALSVRRIEERAGAEEHAADEMEQRHAAQVRGVVATWSMGTRRRRYRGWETKVGPSSSKGNSARFGFQLFKVTDSSGICETA
jgi:hypothetical protein